MKFQIFPVIKKDKASTTNNGRDDQEQYLEICLEEIFLNVYPWAQFD